MGQRGIVHVFEEDLEKSNEKVDWLEQLYRQIFPNMSFIERYPNDMKKQKQGIDLELFLNNGHVIKMDEKRRNRDYGDILLEFAHTNGMKGWIEKDLKIDFISYIIMPNKMLYLLPWIPLQIAWRNNGEQWKQRFGIRDSRNQGYVTQNCPVPPDILWRAIREASFFRLQTYM